MAYTLGITVLDFARIYPAGNPSFSASLTIFGRTPVSATSGGAPTTVLFTTSSSPPTNAGALLLTDPTGPGDLFRSGTVINWPSEPAFITAYTVPLSPVPALPGFAGVGRFSYTQLATLVSSKLPMSFEVPWWMTFLCALFTAFKFMPGRVWISSISFLQSTTGPGIIRAVFGGFIDDTAGESGVNFGGSVDLKPTPSGNAFDATKVIEITAFNLSLNIDPVGASLGPWAVAGVLAPLFAGNLSGPVSDMVNGVIASTVAGMNVPGIAPGLSPTWTISARNVTVAASGIVIQTIASDMPRPHLLMATVVPQPAPTTTAVNYTVTVADTVTGAAIAGATVTLHNFTQTGATADVTGVTDANGQAVFNIALHTKRMIAVTSGGTNRDGKPEREPERISESPTISVTANGYVGLRRPLF